MRYLSNFIKGTNVVMLIDVEGAELKVLKGAKETILKYNPIIIKIVINCKIYCNWCICRSGMR